MHSTRTPLPDRGDGDLAFDDLLEAHRSSDQRPLVLADLIADEIVAIQGLGGRGPHVAGDEELRLTLGRLGVARERDEQQQIREAKVGEHVPGRDQALEVLDVSQAEAGLLADDLGE